MEFIAKQNNEYTIEDSLNYVKEKLISRHPHVFGDKKADAAFHAKQNWELQKHKEKERNYNISSHKRTEQVVGSIVSLLLRRILKNNIKLLKKIESRYNSLLFRIGNLEKKSIKKGFFFHIIGIK